MAVFQNSPQKSPNIWTNFSKKISHQEKIKNCPVWSRCSVATILKSEQSSWEANRNYCQLFARRKSCANIKDWRPIII